MGFSEVVAILHNGRHFQPSFQNGSWAIEVEHALKLYLVTERGLGQTRAVNPSS